ncbi:hypothetical protein HYT57_02515 [Candidatus Woesearchaeota archaeon]|nr:hypothetical protein [Candidatus Woesearchaeota archaeon]
MINLNYEDIITKIKEDRGLSEDEISTRVNEKINQLGDLISKSGAAHIVANELGVKLYDLKKRKLKIKDLIAGLSSVDIVGKVLTLYGIRDFVRNNTPSKVASILIGDETGTVRVVIWDTKQITHLENNDITEGMIIRVKNAYVKENNGFKEMHVGSRGELELNVDEDIGEVRFSSAAPERREKRKISDLKHGDFASLNGYIVQLFEPKFYEACVECNRKVLLDNGKGRCEQHGDVETRKNAILNFYLDDGSGNLRVVAFRDNVKKLIPDPETIQGDAEKFEACKNKLLGSLITVDGKAVKNMMFERIEFLANNIQEFDVDSKIDELLKEI